MTDEKPIEFAYYQGNENVFLLITGLGGTVNGYQEKYVTMARNIIQKYGWSVVVATTPRGSWEHPQENLEYIIGTIEFNLGHGSYQIYAMGYSAGATILLWYSYLFPQIKRVLVVNPVLDYNPQRAIAGLNKFAGERVSVAVGEKDPSYIYVGLIEKTKAQIYRLPGIDHNFTNSLELFIELPNLYLF